MSLLAVSRQIGSAVTLWSLGRHLRVVSMFHHCTHISQHKCARSISDGSRDFSHPAHTDWENVGGSVKTHDRAKSKANSQKFRKKLHNRVFSEQENVDNRTFRNQKFVSESEDVFGNFQRRKETSSVSDRSLGLDSESSFQNEVCGTTKMAAEGNSDYDKSDFSEYTASKGKRNQSFLHKRGLNKQTQRWGDEFGTLSEDSIADRIEESLRTSIGSHEERFSDDEDEEQGKYVRLSAVNRRRIPEWYGRRILKLGKRGQVREAIEVLEDWMLKKDRVMPNDYVFTCLLTVLGRAGFTKKAFSLFRKMRSMGIQPKPATYTALFNACANSPWKKDGQTRADKLVRVMEEKDVKPTFITGKAMVKAFAMCGDLRRAFSLVDELSQVYRPDPEVFSFLLMACISDRQAGLRHAIQVWQVMHQTGVQPDLPLYNLLLRCVRDCGVGDMPSFTALLSGGDTPSQLEAGSAPHTTPLPSHSKPDAEDVVDCKGAEPSSELGSSSVDFGHHSPQSKVEGQESASSSVDYEHGSLRSEVKGHQLQAESDNSHFRNSNMKVKSQVDSQGENIRSQSELTVHSSTTVPDVLSPNCSSNSGIISLGDLSTRENRLLLLGGVEGMLSRMSKDRATPDVITFTQLLSVAMPTMEAERQLLATMKAMKVKPDTDLVNTLIHKRCMRADFAAARAAKEMMVEHGLTANQMTYGVLALTCKTQADAEQLLQDMEACDMPANMEILGSLTYASGLKFGYKLWVLRQTQRLHLPPNTKFLHNVENSLATVRHKTIHAEKQGQTDSYLLSPGFQRSVATFTQHYESWLKQMQVDLPRHPWTNFKPPSEDHKDSASM
ncbi:hypothetical protein ACOMHN_005290 [Nucella lapillus]